MISSEFEKFGDIVGCSLKMREIFGIFEKIVIIFVMIIIEGEIGIGKEVVVCIIYKISLRKDGLFVVFDCGVVFEFFIESELFGYEKGFFIGVVMI